MHKFSFKWAQLTFSAACCSVSLLLVYIFCIFLLFTLYQYFYISLLYIYYSLFISVFIHFYTFVVVLLVTHTETSLRTHSVRSRRQRDRTHSRTVGQSVSVAKDGFYVTVIRLSLSYSSVAAVKRLNGRSHQRYFNIYIPYNVLSICRWAIKIGIESVWNLSLVGSSALQFCS